MELLSLLEEKERRRKQDPLKYSKQHKKQREVTKNACSIRALFWGNRVGKTEWGAQEVVRYVLGKHPYRNIDIPIGVWCASPSFDAQRETTQEKLEFYLPQSEIKDISYVKKNVWGEVVLKNGSRLNFKSYEQGREKFQGVGKRLIWFDEEPPHDIWEECFVRAEAGVPLDIILTMTPIKGMTWVYDDIYLSTGNSDIFVSVAGWDDNPWLTAEQKERMSRGLTKEALLVRRSGKFVKRVGLVCSWWLRDKHLRHYSSLDKSWTFYEVLDGGWSDPAAYLLIGVDGDGRIHVVNGFRERELTAKEIVSRRNSMIGGLTITGGWVDTDNPRLTSDLQSLGMSLSPVVKDTRGANKWDELLAEKLAEYGSVESGTGEPRLYVSDNLIRYDERTGIDTNWLVQEIENLSWLEKSRGNPEVVPKWDDHRKFGHHFDGVRALSYFLVSYQGKKDDKMLLKWAKPSLPADDTIGM